MIEAPGTAEVGAYAVAYLDILGTSQRLEKLEALVLGAETTPGTTNYDLLMETLRPIVTYRELLDRYFKAFRQSRGLESMPREQREKLQRIRESCIQNYGFADSLYAIVRLANQDDWLTPSVGMFTVLFGSCLAMGISLSKKCPLRGGIDVGKGVTLPGNENFSNALVRALKLERQIAGHPRIVIGDDMFKFLEGISNLTYTEGDGKRAADTARAAKRFITEDDADGRHILDYLGEEFLGQVSSGYFADVVQPAYDFVLAEHARVLKERDVKLAPRYGEVRRYFEKRLPLWRA